MPGCLQRALRGTRNLPHVGPHPGTEVLLLFVLLTAGIGLGRAGLLGLVSGALFSLVIYGPFYLIGAAERAEMSDRLERAAQRP